MLDRAGAINDTSLFGAVLVGVGYERIITGGNQSVRLTGDVSQFWTPFLAYADRIGARVAAQSDRRKARRVEQVVASVVKAPQRLEALQELARRFAPDTATFKQQLDEINASAATRGEDAALEEKTRFCTEFFSPYPTVITSCTRKASSARACTGCSFAGSR